jgi:class 3 adenylate cyclase/predicted ATPase
MSAVRAWLEGLGLGQYGDAFEENEVGSDLLSELDHDFLKDLGVAVGGHRLKILRAVRDGAAEDGQNTPEPATEAPPHYSPAQAADAERRQLTVMFCDLVGSTALSERLDPEDLKSLITGYRKSCGDVVTRYEGYVAQYLGDGLMVYFGWPHAHEDDAERAIRASLDIVDTVRRIEATVPLQVRIGIATGPVVVGAGSDQQAQAGQLAVGETPNLAARLQNLADPDHIVVGPGTHRLAGGVFDYDDMGPCHLKGIVEPVHARRVVGESVVEGRFEAQAGIALTPMVGRGEEVELLLSRWRQACDGDGRVVLLSGEPGIGKSRLVQALSERIADEPHTRLRYQSSPFFTNSAFHPFIEHLERAAGFDRADDIDAKLDKMAALLSVDSEINRDTASLFASLLSLPTDRYAPLALTAQRQKELTIEAMAARVKGLSERQPILLLFEDAHWCDPTTVEALTAIIGDIQDARVLLVITYRPEFDPPWVGQGHVGAQSLGRLARRSGEEMINSVTSGKSLPDEVREQIIEKTDGIPLFVEELTRTVLESGVFRETATAYELDGPLPPFAIPTTLQDSLMARLDRLGPIKEVAQIGACIGREFSFELLAAVSSMTDSDLHNALGQLVESGLIYRRGSSVNPQYVFKHALVQEVAYSSLLKGRRQQFHAKIGDILKSRFAAIIEAQPEVLARHFSGAGSYEQAAQQWLIAGRHAGQRSAIVEALAHLRAGLVDVAELEPGTVAYGLEIDLQAAIATTLVAVAGPGVPEMAAALKRAEALAKKLDDPRRLLTTLIGLGTNLYIRADFDRLLGLFEEMMRLVSQTQDDVGAVVMYRTQGTVHLTVGDFVTARRSIETALEMYRPDMHRAEALAYGHEPLVSGQSLLANIYWLLGYPDQAVALGRQAMENAEDIDHTHTLAFGLNYAVWMCLFLRDVDGVRRLAEDLISLSTTNRFPVWLETANVLRGWSLGCDGAAIEGIEVMTGALARYRAFGGVLSLPFLLSLLAETHVRAGDVEAALTCIDDGLTHVREFGEIWWEAELHRAKGTLLADPGLDRADDAEACLRRCIEIADGQQAKSLSLRGATALARLWQGQEKPHQAHDLLAPIYNWFTEGFDTADLKDAKALLEELKTN